MNELQFSKKPVPDPELSPKIPLDLKPKIIIKNIAKKPLKVSNLYLDEHLLNLGKKKSFKNLNEPGPKNTQKPKHLKNPQKQSMLGSKQSTHTKEQTSTDNLQNVTFHQKSSINCQFTGLPKNENLKLFENEYKHQRESLKPKMKLGNKIRPERSLSSSSAQSNSYYGIVAEYRKRRLQSQNSSECRNSLENSVSVSGESRGKILLKRVKSQEVVQCTGSFKEEHEDGRKFEWQRPKLGKSVSSRDSIKSSQSNLSSSTAKVLIEQKVSLMKEKLKLRKGISKESNEQMISSSKRIQNPLKKFMHIEGVPFNKSRIQYHPESTDYDSEANKYKQLYKISLEKVKNVEKQLEIQKKKNELTKNIFKAEIDKLKRVKSYECLYEERQESVKVLDKIDAPEAEYPTGIKMKLKEKEGNYTINELKEKLKNSHLFTYQEYQGVTAVPNKSHKSASLYQKQTNESSILIPNNQDAPTLHNISNEMIVEMSSEWRESFICGSSFVAKSKIINSRQIEQCHKVEQHHQIKNSEFSFKKIEYCFDDSLQEQSKDEVQEDLIREESLLLDLSSNVDHNKSFMNLENESPSHKNFMNLLQDSDMVQNSVIQVKATKKQSTEAATVLNSEFQEQQSPKYSHQKSKCPTKILNLKKDFAEDSSKRSSAFSYETEYDSTESANTGKNQYKMGKKNHFTYQ